MTTSCHSTCFQCLKHGLLFSNEHVCSHGGRISFVCKTNCLLSSAHAVLYNYRLFVKNDHLLYGQVVFALQITCCLVSAGENQVNWPVSLLTGSSQCLPLSAPPVTIHFSSLFLKPLKSTQAEALSFLLSGDQLCVSTCVWNGSTTPFCSQIFTLNCPQELGLVVLKG